MENCPDNKGEEDEGEGEEEEDPNSGKEKKGYCYKCWIIGEK